MKHLMVRALPITLLLTTATRLSSDGGAVILHRENGPFAITVFASPTPARAGIIDLSVLLQSSDSRQSILDGTVEVEFSQGGQIVRAAATHSQAQNKLLYAVPIRLNKPGEWNYKMTIRKSTQTTEVADVIRLASEPTRFAEHAGLLAFPFVCLAVLALHQWLSVRKLMPYQVGSR